ncbi:MAG: glycosyltransferase family 4 protein [Nitrospirota bacterium]
MSSLFPNNQQPTFGIFVKERISRIARLCNIKVIAPVPWFPKIKFIKEYYCYSQISKEEKIEGLDVLHPRFFIFPKIFKSLDGFLYFVSILLGVLKVKKIFNFDIIDCHWVYPDGFAAVLLGKILKKPVVITIRGPGVLTIPGYRIRKKLAIWSLKQSNYIITVCEAIRQEAIKAGIPGEKIITIPNGIDTQKFYPIDKIKARERLNLPLDKKIILSVGYLCKRKGFHHIIDAISMIMGKTGRKDFLLIIVGGSESGAEGDFKPNLERQIKELGLIPYIQLVGQKPHNELYLWYNTCDIFCLASSKEGWANVLFEAIACGKPVVATNIWGTPEVIKSDEYGILINEQTGEAIAEGILKALNKNWDPKKLIEYAQENTWEEVAKKVFDLCNRTKPSDMD